LESAYRRFYRPDLFLDTVERNILDLAARQGLSLYTVDNAVGTLNVTPFAVESNKKDVEGKTQKREQKGDFITKYVSNNFLPLS
jgi:hypothetical protein